MADYGLTFYDKKDFNFSNDSNEFIVENVKRVLMTRPGERVNNLSFGSNLRSYLFEPEMLMDDIAHEIVTSLNRWEPRADVKDIKISMKNEKVVIKLTIRNKTNQDILTTSLEAAG
jgi:phage baseplate assembly protein W